MEILVNLCREIYLVLDLEPEEPIFYDPYLLEQEFYIFYIDITQEKDINVLKSRCESLRNHITLFILYIKQTTLSSSEYEKNSAIESITLLTNKIIKFLENLAINSNEELILNDLSKILSIINTSHPFNSIKTYIAGSILKEKQHLENILQDINKIPLNDISLQGRELINQQIIL